MKNDRNEWELPGGRLESPIEDPTEALQREFREETGLAVRVLAVVDSWVFEVLPKKHVFIVTYLVEADSEPTVTTSGEHKSYLLADPDNLPENLPSGYILSIKAAMSLGQRFA